MTSLTAASSPRSTSLSTSDRSKSIRPVPSALIWAPVTSVPGKRSNTNALRMCESVCSERRATAPVGVDPHDHVAGQLDLVAEHVPPAVAVDLHAGDLDHAAGVLEPAGVAHLPATAGMERRAVELHPARRGVDDTRRVLVEVGLLVTQVHSCHTRLRGSSAVSSRRRGAAVPSYSCLVR